jgi:cell wall assembly regulator SMI1
MSRTGETLRFFLTLDNYARRAGLRRLPPGATDNEIAAAEARIGKSFPFDLRLSLIRLNGATIGDDAFSGIGRRVSEEQNIEAILQRIPYWAQAGWFPILGDGWGSYYCVSDAAPWVFFVDHEQGYDKVAYVVSSRVQRFVILFLENPLRRTDEDAARWFCDRERVAALDPDVLSCGTFAPGAWEVPGARAASRRPAVLRTRTVEPRGGRRNDSHRDRTAKRVTGPDDSSGSIPGLREAHKENQTAEEIELVDKLKRTLADRSAKASVKSGPQGATDSEIAAVEAELGTSLPRDLRFALSVSNGVSIGDDVFLGIGRRVHKNLRIEEALSDFPYWTDVGWFPILGDGCGNYYCVSASAPWVFFVDHEEGLDKVAYVVASRLLRFMILRIENPFNPEDDNAVSWYFDRSRVESLDPEALSCGAFGRGAWET